MNLILLPHEGETWLFRIIEKEQEQVLTPLVIIKTDVSAQYIFDFEKKRLAIMDQDGKRFALYRLYDESPWIETILLPMTLQRNNNGKCIHFKDDVLFAGGHSKNGEMMWLRSGAEPDVWQNVLLPSLQFSKKCIDGFGLHADILYAVDDYSEPKYTIIFDISNPLEPVSIATVPLQDSGTVILTAQHEKHLAMIGIVISFYGCVASFSIMDLRNAAMVGHISFKQCIYQASTEKETENPVYIALYNAKRIVGHGTFWFIACGKYGIVRMSVFDIQEELTIDPEFITIEGLSEVYDIAIPAGTSGFGYAVGLDEKGKRKSQLFQLAPILL